MKNDVLGDASLYFVIGQLYLVNFNVGDKETATAIYNKLNQKYNGETITNHTSTAKTIQSPTLNTDYRESQLFTGDKAVILQQSGNLISLWFTGYMKRITDSAIEISRLKDELDKAEQKEEQKKNIKKVDDL
jgi:hypothetical protein